MKRLSNKAEKRALLAAIMTGDRELVTRLIDDHIPKGDTTPLFWERDADGFYCAGKYRLTPDEYRKLNDVYPCY
jgi:hypothetical protein